MLQMLQRLFQPQEKAEYFPVPEPMKLSQPLKHDAQARVPLSVEEISAQYQQCLVDVDQPKHHQALKSMFDFDNGINLTQCISLGIGNFGIRKGAEAWWPSNYLDTSLHQLAVLAIILRALRERQHSIQEVYFQDPAFVDVEVTFLQSLGYTVLENPAACEKMSASTFLFAPYLGFDVASKAFSVAYPGLYIGNDPRLYLEDLAGFASCRTSSVKEKVKWEFQPMVDVIRQFQDSVVDGEPLPGFNRQGWTEATTVHWLSRTLAADSVTETITK